MNVSDITARVLSTLPRTTTDAQDAVRHALGVLAEEPQMRWACIALLLSGLGLVLTRAAVGTTVAVLALGVTSVAWFRVDQAREGAVLIKIAPTHGLTEADLLVPVVVVFAVLGRSLLAMVRRTRRRARSLDRPLDTLPIG